MFNLSPSYRIVRSTCRSVVRNNEDIYQFALSAPATGTKMTGWLSTCGERLNGPNRYGGRETNQGKRKKDLIGNGLQGVEHFAPITRSGDRKESTATNGQLRSRRDEKDRYRNIECEEQRAWFEIVVTMQG